MMRNSCIFILLIIYRRQVLSVLQGSPDSFKSFLGHFVGQAPSNSSTGSGLVSFLSSKDWPLRKTSAEALRSMAILHGPDLKDTKAGSNSLTLILRAKKALQASRFDKVHKTCSVHGS